MGSGVRRAVCAGELHGRGRSVAGAGDGELVAGDVELSAAHAACDMQCNDFGAELR